MMPASLSHLLVLGALAMSVGPMPGEAARILAIMPIMAKSHHIWTSSLTSALAARGHHVHSIDIAKPRLQPPTLNLSLLDPPPDSGGLETIVNTLNKGSVFEKIELFLHIAITMCEGPLEQRVVQELISPDFKGEFDLIILNYVNHECFLGFIHRFNYIPMVLTSPFPKPGFISRLLGNPMFHGLPHYFKDFPVPMSNWQRLTTLGIQLLDDLTYQMYTEPAMNGLLRKNFGDDVPTVRELANHVALALVNLVDTVPKPPLVSSIIPVGGMHIPPVEPLPKKLKDFLDGAKDGAVIMSFGTIVRGESMGAEKRDAVFRVFSRLPQRLIWKYEAEDQNVKVPPNVMLLPWLPQNDVLAHPNIRLFVSHCGGLSSMEAAYHGVPILGVPFMADQFPNSEHVVASGVGLRLTLDELTEDTLYGNITDLLSNPKYYQTAQKSRAVMQDQLVKPLDRAIYYVEYVLRHKGARHLRSPLLDQPFHAHTLLMDIVFVTAIFLIVILCFFAALFKILRCIWRCLSRSPPKSQTEKTTQKTKKKD